MSAYQVVHSKLHFDVKKRRQSKAKTHLPG
jgi:hypothetical protein